MTANQLENLLCKPVWNYKDVMSYCDCGATTAYEIIEELRGPDPLHKKEGWVSNFPKMVKRDAVLHYLETNPETEMGIAIVAKVAGSILRTIGRIAEGGEADGGI